MKVLHVVHRDAVDQRLVHADRGGRNLAELHLVGAAVPAPHQIRERRILGIGRICTALTFTPCVAAAGAAVLIGRRDAHIQRTRHVETVGYLQGRRAGHGLRRRAVPQLITYVKPAATSAGTSLAVSVYVFVSPRNAVLGPAMPTVGGTLLMVSVTGAETVTPP